MSETRLVPADINGPNTDAAAVIFVDLRRPIGLWRHAQRILTAESGHKTLVLSAVMTWRC